MIKIKQCAYCQEEFNVKIWNQKTCSTACGDKIRQSKNYIKTRKKIEPGRRDTATYGSGYDI